MEEFNMNIRTVRRVPPHVSPPIEQFLGKDDVDRIYEVWGEGVKKYNWDTPITLRGGVKTITMDMLKGIPREELEDIYYQRRTERIMEALTHVS